MTRLFLFLVCLGSLPLYAQTRIIPHLTRAGGGFVSAVQAQNADAGPLFVTLSPFTEDGTPLNAVRVEVAGMSTANWSIEELFPGQEGVSHFTIETEDEVSLSVSYTAQGSGGSPAHVPEQNEQSARFSLFKGNWSSVFDAVAVVNAGAAPTSVFVTQWLDGVAQRSIRIADLDPFAKFLYVIGGEGFDNFEDLDGSWFEVHGGQPLAVTALRGNLDGSTFLWPNSARPWTPAVVKVNDDNPSAANFTDPFQLGPDAPDVNNMPQGEVFIDVAPDGRLVGCAKDYRYSPVDTTTYNDRVWNGIYFSSDDGNSWDNRMFMESDPNQGLTAITRDSFGQTAGTVINFDHMSDPVVAVDRDGNIYTSALPYELRPNSVSILEEPSAITMVRRDADGNLDPERVHYLGLEDDPTMFNDKNWLICSKDTPGEETIVIASWRLFSSALEDGTPATIPSGAYIAISGDGAATVSEPIRLPVDPDVVGATQFYQPLLGPNPQTGSRMLYVFHRAFNNEISQMEMFLLKSDIGGITGTQALYDHLNNPDNWDVLDPLLGGFFYGFNGYGLSFRGGTHYIPAVDDETGVLYAVSSFFNTETSGADIVITQSLDAGDTWSQPMMVDPPPAGTIQTMPWVIVDEGTVSVLWYDSRHQSTALSVRPAGVDIYYAELELDLTPRRVLRLTPETQVAEHPVFTRPRAQSKISIGPLPHDRGLGQGPFLFETLNKDATECDGYGFIGDYIGLAANGDYAYAIWTDLRDLNTEMDICEGNQIQGRRNQNVYFARIKKR